jgi:hypothetical protein
MRTTLIASLLAAAAAFAAPAAAQETVKMTCPVGGESFDYIRAAATAPTGMRPDGKPLGTPLAALPECPGNGLVLYKDYSAEEAGKLAPLVESAEYQALREGETQRYRAYRLMRHLGEEPDNFLWVLLQASWEAEDRPELRTRYLAELVEAAGEVPPRRNDINWIGMEGRVINALRELGRFEEAEKRLNDMPLLFLDVQVPTGEDADRKAVAEARARRGWLLYANQLRKAVERRDASIEPLDMMPRTAALARCTELAGKLSEAQQAFCSASETDGKEEQKAARAPTPEELEALRKSREQSGR